MKSRRLVLSVFALIGITASVAPRTAVCAAEPAGAAPGWSLDHRYAPPWWQTSICLPDDWQKTLVGKEGRLLYDFRGKFSGFKTRIGFRLEGDVGWVGQELASPRVPVVRTLKRSGPVEIVEEAFAVAPPLPPGQDAMIQVERLDTGGNMPNWAAPKGPCDPAFRHIAVAMSGSVRYRFRAEKGKTYAVVLGLCEGHWTEPAKRPLQLVIEGRARQKVDMIGEHGHNVPAVFPFEVKDENGDGWIEVTVDPVDGAPDRNTILNALWVFDGAAPPAEQLIAGTSRVRPLAYVDCGTAQPESRPPRHDLVIARLRNTGAQPVKVTPTLLVESEQPIVLQPDKRHVLIGSETKLASPVPFARAAPSEQKLSLWFEPAEIPGGGEHVLAVGVARGSGRRLVPKDMAEAEKLLARSQRYWEEVELPYGHVRVPDEGVQALLDSAVRNIYQAREIKKGLPAFQVGPTCYRGLWVVDGSFLLEAVTFLGEVDDARAGVRYLLDFQRDDGAFMLIDGHWKETGIAMWAVARHARLTDDPTWLLKVWPQIERGFDYVRKMRAMTYEKPDAPNRGLIPVGFSDGGLGGKYPEYTNVYWTLVGMKAAVEAAEWLGRMQQAAEWRHEYDDFLATFRRAAERDMKTDAHGNRYLPIRMVDDENVAPQKAQWAFLHAVFPGKVFAPDDPLVRGNLAMLEANEREGLVFGTGWLSDGLWNYFGSFYGHAWLWAGRGQKAAGALYAFGNHASPLLAWREEQLPQGGGERICGDMPHNWASAEFLRLTRHLLVLKRGRELHLLEGLPPAWIVPGESVRVRDVLTEFGPISFELRTAADGSHALLDLVPPRRNPPREIVVHLTGWSGREGTVRMPVDGPSQREIPLAQPAK